MLALVACNSTSNREACNDASTTTSAAADVAIDATPVRYEATTRQFCRPDLFGGGFETQRTLTNSTLEEMANDGWVYQGPIHNDGINCLVIYFTRVARPSTDSDAGNNEVVFDDANAEPKAAVPD